MLGPLLEPLPAAAEPGDEVVGRLVYTRAEGAAACPEERAVHDIFLEQLGRNILTDQGPARLVLTITSHPGAGRGDMTGHIELLDAEEHRVWSNDLQASHDDCATLIASLALSLRVAQSTLNGTNNGAPPLVKPPAQPDSPIVVQGSPLFPSGFDPRLLVSHVPTPAPQVPPPSDAPSFEVWGSAAAAIGAAPIVPLRVAIDLGLSWPMASVFFESRGFLPIRGQISGYMVEVTRWEAAFVPCFHRGLLFGCGLLSAGGVWILTEGPKKENNALFHAAGGLRAGLDLTMTSNIGLLAFVDVEASFLQREIKANEQVLWREPTVQVAVGIAFAGAYPHVQQ